MDAGMDQRTARRAVVRILIGRFERSDQAEPMEEPMEKAVGRQPFGSKGRRGGRI